MPKTVIISNRDIKEYTIRDSYINSKESIHNHHFQLAACCIPDDLVPIPIISRQSTIDSRHETPRFVDELQYVNHSSDLGSNELNDIKCPCHTVVVVVTCPINIVREMPRVIVAVL